VDPIRLRVSNVNILLRTWDSESLFSSYMAANDGAFLNPEEHRHGNFVTIESDRLSDPGSQRRFLIGFSDWGSPSFVTFAVNSDLSLLACGCNNTIYSISALTGEIKQFRLAGFFRNFILVSPTSLILDAEAGVYNLSWDLDLSWHVSTDLIQSTALTGSQILLETDSGSSRLDLQTGELLP
jgi:hypothetical protein